MIDVINEITAESNLPASEVYGKEATIVVKSTEDPAFISLKVHNSLQEFRVKADDIIAAVNNAANNANWERPYRRVYRA